MITASELYAFIRAFPAAINLIKQAIDAYTQLQLKMIDNAAQEKITQLETDIARLKNAKTNADIASIIASLNHRG